MNRNNNGTLTYTSLHEKEKFTWAGIYKTVFGFVIKISYNYPKVFLITITAISQTYERLKTD